MNHTLTTLITISMLLISVSVTQAQDSDHQQLDDYEDDDPTTSSFKPSIYVVVAVLSFMFTTTFLLLVYAKYCHHPPAAVHNVTGITSPGPSPRFSGLDRAVIESLPLFRFSAVKLGSQCSVCLSEFEGSDLLRLLPECKHSFHVKCIDQWLERHSSCPLCRLMITAQEPKTGDVSSSSIFELFLERVDDHMHEKHQPNPEVPHGFNHRIQLMSDIMCNSRWSNITSSDMLFLNSEMLGAISTGRFSSSEEINVVNSDTGVTITGGNRRSMSEITGVSRFKDAISMNNKVRNCVNEVVISDNDCVNQGIKKRKVWLSIVKRTVEWFVNRENDGIRSQQDEEFHVTQQILFV